METETYLVGYGTLLNRDSLGNSIGSRQAEDKKVLPVIVKDYRRLFNLRPDHYPSSDKLGRGEIEKAAMNVEPSSGHSFNGLAFPVSGRELEILDERERYYERRQEPLFDFRSGNALGRGYLYAARPDAPWIDRVPDQLMPLWRDIVWSRAGAYRISRDFGRFFDQTTYLADGKILMADFYRRLLTDPQPSPAEPEDPHSHSPCST